MTVLSIENVSIQFGGIKALEDVSFSLGRQEILALIGPNGAGKTTLFNVISGVYKPTSGRVLLNDVETTTTPPFKLAGMGLTRTFQNLQVFMNMTAVENVMVGRNIHERGSVLSHFLGLPATRAQNKESHDRALELLEFVGLKEYADRTANELPYGVLKRLEIARALAMDPQVLLLDEPVAGCNATETAEVDDVIRDVVSKGVSVILVEHDIHLVMSIASRIHVLDRGKTLAEGLPSEIRRHPAVIEAYLGSEQAKEVEYA